MRSLIFTQLAQPSGEALNLCPRSGPRHALEVEVVRSSLVKFRSIITALAAAHPAFRAASGASGEWGSPDGDLVVRAGWFRASATCLPGPTGRDAVLHDRESSDA